jgi:predicted transcriptional regulator of viral defense system
MSFDELVRTMGKQGWFDLATLVQLTGTRRASLVIQLHRWVQSGKLLSLRRGMYALPEPYRRRALGAAEIANNLYAPSYLSTHWALGYYGMIPEYVQRFTSVTRRKPASFENGFGVFVYRNIKQSIFFGYEAVEIAGARVQIAQPEKALLDLWHLENGPWTRPRMLEMRFQSPDTVDRERLRTYAERFHSPRVEAALNVWLELEQEEEEGVEL